MISTSKSITSISAVSSHTYNNFVRSHEDGWICSETNWAYVLENCFPHIRNRSLVLQEHEGDICGALPLFHVKSFLTGSRLVSVPFATLSSPMLCKTDFFKLFYQEMKAQIQKTRSSYVEIRAMGERRALSNFASLERKYVCHFIDLQQPLAKIHNSFHRSIRRYLKKEDVKIRAAESVEDVIQHFYRLYFYTRKRLFLPAMPKGFFERLWEMFHEKENISFLFVEIDDRPVASLMLLKYGKRVSAEAIGWDIDYVEHHPTALLYWESIRRAHAEGYTTFDFGRTDPANKGLMTYKNRWGAKMSDLAVYRFTEENVESKRSVGSMMSPSLQRILFGLPEPFYTALSRFSYRHLG